HRAPSCRHLGWWAARLWWLMRHRSRAVLCGAGFIPADGGGDPTPAGTRLPPAATLLRSRGRAAPPWWPMPRRSRAVLCGAGFIPADWGGDATAVGNRTPPAGIKPAPQGEGSAALVADAAPEPGCSVWGRVYPGRRGGGRNRSREPDAAGRRKAGPTGGGWARLGGGAPTRARGSAMGG